LPLFDYFDRLAPILKTFIPPKNPQETSSFNAWAIAKKVI